jgi:predicted acetyltransferase
MDADFIVLFIFQKVGFALHQSKEKRKNEKKRGKIHGEFFLMREKREKGKGSKRKKRQKGKEKRREGRGVSYG